MTNSLSETCPWKPTHLWWWELPARYLRIAAAAAGAIGAYPDDTVAAGCGCRSTRLLRALDLPPQLPGRRNCHPQCTTDVSSGSGSRSASASAGPGDGSDRAAWAAPQRCHRVREAKLRGGRGGIRGRSKGRDNTEACSCNRTQSLRSGNIPVNHIVLRIAGVGTAAR